jgi:transposase-like protein
MSGERRKGKIPHSEWSEIARRYGAGETLTEIARRYDCTAPAIRYIIKRQRSGPQGRERAGGRPGLLQRRSPGATHPNAVSAAIEMPAKTSSTERVPASFWTRVSSDIASFLAAMDATIADENDATHTTLLEAADRLLRVSALTRLEIERVRRARQKTLHVV